MNSERPRINILTRHHAPVFTQHFDPLTDGFDVIENGDSDEEWDLVVVFEDMARAASWKVRSGKAIFIGGEPPDIGSHSERFFNQFDAIYCTAAKRGSAPFVSGHQHYNNWHFGYSARQEAYRFDHQSVIDLAPPEKSMMLSTVTSNLNYMPMHIRRRALVIRLAEDYAGEIEFFGRPHRFVEYKEDAILPFRFHLCVENCSVPDLWTEKIADALLGYAIPVYAGCPNIEQYFPGATIPIDLHDYHNARRTIDEILTNGECIYRSRFDALVAARKRLVSEFDISALIGAQLGQGGGGRNIILKPEADFPFARTRNFVARTRRKANTLACRTKMVLHG